MTASAPAVPPARAQGLGRAPDGAQDRWQPSGQVPVSWREAGRAVGADDMPAAGRAVGDRSAGDEPAGDEPAPAPAAGLPAWMRVPEAYVPPRDRDGFLVRTALSLASALERMRLDDGQASPLSPSPAMRLAVGLVLVLLVSLARNFAFVLVALAALLVREALLPVAALRRCVGASLAAAGLTAVLMAPAALLGQGQAPLLVGGKVLVCVGVATTLALSAPAGELAEALRALRVPAAFVQTVELAQKGVVELGRTAREVLCALGLRSVGRNRDKGGSLGGVLGVTVLKAGQAARTTADAMRCRGFEGEYAPRPRPRRRVADVAWGALLVLAVALFAYLEGVL